ncbi:unnamed protein product [Pleuronectes platessa]|uniref:Uncharacterized protein n=1 Tax=Pleuronectes platessa TaxID=8262 RepID=A0A9N7U4J5_PLEPL|nr:unnamed protein product [Pleuronectes platessa]
MARQSTAQLQQARGTIQCQSVKKNCGASEVRKWLRERRHKRKRDDETRRESLKPLSDRGYNLQQTVSKDPKICAHLLHLQLALPEMRECLQESLDKRWTVESRDAIGVRRGDSRRHRPNADLYGELPSTTTSNKCKPTT